MLNFIKVLSILITTDNLNKNVEISTLQLILKGLCQQIQDGLTLADIENILFFIIFVRFLVLAIRYNLKSRES